MLDSLERSVMKYFRAEEEIHRELAFPDAYLHKSHHKKYIAMFGRFKRGYMELGPTLFNVIKFEESAELLRKHIVSFDRDFASYYHACRADFLSESIGA
jgi:hemerythrin